MQVVTGDILDETHGLIVHGCNAQGKFASGLAAQIALRYPQAFFDYMRHYKSKKLRLGDVIETKVGENHYILSTITQRFYGRVPGAVYVDYDAVIDVFEKVNILALKTHLPVKFPRIGCGLAKGNWKTIEEIIQGCLDPSIERTLYDLK
jgi:O-acetyl-ADP-ribose deacetylase (regulator of RNase III)